jgi:hypothetical protein
MPIGFGLAVFQMCESRSVLVVYHAWFEIQRKLVFRTLVFGHKASSLVDNVCERRNFIPI